MIAPLRQSAIRMRAVPTMPRAERAGPASVRRAVTCRSAYLIMIILGIKIGLRALLIVHNYN